MPPLSENESPVSPARIFWILTRPGGCGGGRHPLPPPRLPLVRGPAARAAAAGSTSGWRSSSWAGVLLQQHPLSMRVLSLKGLTGQIRSARE